jgi:hypothetical protein
VTKLAARLKIQVHFTPSGLTDTLRLLNRSILVDSTQLTDIFSFGRVTKMGGPGAVQMLLEAWGHLWESTVEESWQPYGGKPEDREPPFDID